VRLSGFRRWLAVFVCLLPLAIGFLYPFGKMVRWAWLHLASDAGFLFSSGEAIARGTGLAAATAIFMPLLAAVFAYAVRQRENRKYKLMDRLAGLGYATPGAVIAVGVLVVFGTFDRWDVPFIPLLSGSLLVIGFAYVVRFFAIPLQFSRAGMERIGKPVEEASRLLGHGPLATFLRVDLPLLKGPLIAAGMLLFVDILKELPLTLILRPANFETLATTAFSLAKESRLQACAVPSLMIVLAGAIGLLVMNRWMVKPSLND
jgi:iron(III) transport system permease protein